MTDDVKLCPKCLQIGKEYEEGSFPCKIRHLSINSGVAKAAKDGSGNLGFGLNEQRD